MFLRTQICKLNWLIGRNPLLLEKTDYSNQTVLNYFFSWENVSVVMFKELGQLVKQMHIYLNSRNSSKYNLYCFSFSSMFLLYLFLNAQGLGENRLKIN